MQKLNDKLKSMKQIYFLLVYQTVDKILEKSNDNFAFICTAGDKVFLSKKLLKSIGVQFCICSILYV